MNTWKAQNVFFPPPSKGWQNGSQEMEQIVKVNYRRANSYTVENSS